MQFCYVYILRSVNHPDRHYVGFTDDLRARLIKHNSGSVSHTAKHRPWEIKRAVAFRDRPSGIAFERYLKTASGRAFAKNHL